MTLTAMNVDERSRFVWKDENGNILGDKKLLKVDEAGDYFVTAIKYSCTTESQLVHVDALVDSLFVPNVFTPNGDSYNDYFQIDGSDLNDFNVLIYNRYGDLVYENNEPSFKWEATGFSAGTYFWKVVYENCSGEVKESKGWVQLVR